MSWIRRTQLHKPPTALADLETSKISFKTLSVGFALGVAEVGLATANVAPTAFVRVISSSVLSAAKTDARVQGGDLDSIVALVDAKVCRSATWPR